MRTGDLVVQLTRALDNRQWNPACWLTTGSGSQLVAAIVQMESQHVGYHHS